MRPSKKSRGKAASPARGKSKSFSTSKGRANLAAALATAARDKTIVGFDRYRKPIAALVPIDAILMLSGQDGSVDPAVRDRIVRTARVFVAAMQSSRGGGRAPAAKKQPRKAAPKKKASKRSKAKAKARRKPVGNSF
jgi:hypothetical protein